MLTLSSTRKSLGTRLIESSSKELECDPSGFSEFLLFINRPNVFVVKTLDSMSIEVKVQRDKYQQKCKHDCIKILSCVSVYGDTILFTKM